MLRVEVDVGASQLFSDGRDWLCRLEYFIDEGVLKESILGISGRQEDEDEIIVYYDRN